MVDYDEDCIFCKITSGKDEKTTLIYQDENYAVFSDLKPASTHHLLVCPKKHILDAKVLTKSDIPMVEQLAEIAKKVLTEKGANFEKTKLGFHWPPFCSVKHLHLHAINPEDQMKLTSKLFGIYSPNSPWFASLDFVMDRLKKMPD